MRHLCSGDGRKKNAVPKTKDRPCDSRFPSCHKGYGLWRQAIAGRKLDYLVREGPAPSHYVEVQDRTCVQPGMDRYLAREGQGRAVRRYGDLSPAK